MPPKTCGWPVKPKPPGDTAEDTTYFSRIALANRAWERPDVFSASSCWTSAGPRPASATAAAGNGIIWRACATRNWCTDEWPLWPPAIRTCSARVQSRRTVARHGLHRFLAGSEIRHRLWDTADYRFVRGSEIPVEMPGGLRFSRDGRQLAVLDREDRVVTCPPHGR